MDWTAELKDKLRGMLRERMTFDQIGKVLGISRSAVAGAKKRHIDDGPVVSAAAVAKPIKRAQPVKEQRYSFHWNEERSARLKVLAMQGLVAKAIANDIGTTDADIRRHAKKLGVNIRYNPAHRTVHLRSGREIATGGTCDAAVNPLGHSIMNRFQEGYRGQRGKVPIGKLGSMHCRFPIDTKRGTRYCGETVMAASVSYCEHHARRCYERLPK